MRAVVELAVSANFLPMIGLAFLLYFALTNLVFEPQQRKLFLAAICINMVLICATALDYIFAEYGTPGMILARRITSFLNFAAAPLIPILLSQIFKQMRRSLWYYMPTLVSGLLCFFSMFSPLIFSITEQDGHSAYARGPLFFVPFAVMLGYLLLLMRDPSSVQKVVKRKERLFLLCIAGVFCAAMAAEIVFRFHFLMWTWSAYSLSLYYLFLNLHFLMRDALTGVNNRTVYQHDLTAVRGKRSCLLALVDLNDLKTVNDAYGHSAGDRMLVGLVRLLKKHVRDMATLYRVGGDEFVLLSEKPHQREQLAAALAGAQAQGLENGISFAVGQVEYNAEKDDFDEMLLRMDASMYENKKQVKAQAPDAAATWIRVHPSGEA